MRWWENQNRYWLQINFWVVFISKSTLLLEQLNWSKLQSATTPPSKVHIHISQPPDIIHSKQTRNSTKKKKVIERIVIIIKKATKKKVLLNFYYCIMLHIRAEPVRAGNIRRFLLLLAPTFRFRFYFLLFCYEFFILFLFFLISS